MPDEWKCSAARMIACSKSGCSNSFKVYVPSLAIAWRILAQLSVQNQI